MAAIGAGLALGALGTAISGSGRRDYSTPGGMSGEERNIALARSRAALKRLEEGVLPKIGDAFGISQEEQARRRELIATGTARTTEDVIDAIRAEAARSGVTNAPGFVTGRIARARGDIGFQRLGQEVSLDEAIRGGKIGALGFESDINKYLSGPGGMPELAIGASTAPQTHQRSQTFGETVGPALAGFGGQLAGYGMASGLQSQYLSGLRSAFQTPSTASTAPEIGPASDANWYQKSKFGGGRSMLSDASYWY